MRYVGSMIAPQGFHHVAVLVSDVEGVSRFYRERLGLPELIRHYHPDGRLRSVWVGARANGGVHDGFFAIEHAGGPGERAGGFGMVALRIEAADRARVRAELVDGGVTLERETAYTLYVRDPEGNLVGLSHFPTAGPAGQPGA